MNQIEKIESRSMIGNRLFANMRNPANQKFFPFYYFTNFEVKKDDPIYCDYCGELLDGNGSYATAYFVWENPETIKICCSVRSCLKGAKVWDYHHQIHGQSKHIQLPECSTPEMRLVYHWAFSGGETSAAYKIMNFKKVASFDDLKEIINTDWGGGSYHKDGASWYDYHNYKLLSYNYIKGTNYDKAILISLSSPDILKIINEMLSAMYIVQLKLF